MKKFLVLVAVFALAFSMGPVSDAFAEATIYGKMHMSLDMVDGDSPAVGIYQDPNLTVASNSSRIGFKGSQRLDGGMDLIWQVETGFAMDGDSGSNDLSARNRFLGLKGGFGTVMLGNHDTPMKTTGRKVDLFGDRVGDTRSVISVGGWDARVINAVMYKNKLGPIDLFLQYSADTVAQVTVDHHVNSSYGGSVTWKGGPVWVSGAFEKHHAGAGQISEAALRAAVSVDVGDALKIVGLFQTTEDETNTAGDDRDTIGVGASFALGDITLKGQAYMADDLGPNVDTGGKLIVFGVDTKLSKTTTLYAAFAQADNDNNTNVFIPNGGGHGDDLAGLDNGSSPTAISVGMIYTF